MGENSTNNSDAVRGDYTLIPLVSTPKINPGEKISVDYYVTGRHPKDDPPEHVRLNVNLNGISMKSGRFNRNIAQQWEDDGSSVYLKKEEGIEGHELSEGQNVFSLKIPETMFLPNPDMVDDEDPYSSPPIHGELGINEDGTPPLRLEIETSENQSAGNHEITSTLVFQQEQIAGIDRVTRKIHVNTFYEEYQFWINAVVIALTLFGVLFPVIRFFFL